MELKQTIGHDLYEMALKYKEQKETDKMVRFFILAADENHIESIKALIQYYTVIGNQEETEKEYQKEALASNVDYQKFINPYGVQSGQLRQSGLSNAGYSESTKLGAYSTSQQRTALARETAKKIKADFDVEIQEAKLKGDTQLAEIALQQMLPRLS